MIDLRPGQIRRLVAYYHFLRDTVEVRERKAISSAELAELIDVDDTQVRKDLAAIDVRGCPRVGFDIREVIDAVRVALGFDTLCPAVIVGAGRLGGAIAFYPNFAHFGLEIVAVLDANPAVIGTQVDTHTVQDVETLEAVVRTGKICVGILTVPATAAQALADRLVAAGICGIWNFAPTQLVVPEQVVVIDVHLSASLAELSYHVQRGRFSGQATAT